MTFATSVLRAGLRAGILRTGLAALALAALGTGAVNAAIVFDNTASSYGAWSASSGLLGMEFVPSASGLLQAIELPLSIAFKPAHGVVTLYAGPQTTLLDSWDITVSTPLSAFGGPTTLTPDTAVHLTAGEAYWVFLASPDFFSDEGVLWAWNLNPAGTLYSSYGTGDGGYDLPGSQYNKQFALKVTAAVPEPASWALFILGFGGIGASLRARRGRQAVLA